MHSREEIYRACMKLRLKAKEYEYDNSCLCYDDPFGYGLKLFFSKEDDRIWIKWAYREVFFGMPSKPQWHFVRGAWEEYLMVLVTYDGDAKVIKSECRDLEVYRFIADYERRFFSRIYDAATFIVEQVGVNKVEEMVAEKECSINRGHRSKLIIQKRISESSSCVYLRVKIYNGRYYEFVERKHLPREFALCYKIYIVWSVLDDDYREIRVERDDNLHGVGEDYLGMLFDWRDELINKKKSRRKRLTREESCKILGVSENAMETEIKKIYHDLARKYHPDGHNGQEWAEEKFKEILEAYQALTS